MARVLASVSRSTYQSTSFLWSSGRSIVSSFRSPARLRSGSPFRNVVSTPALPSFGSIGIGKTYGLILPAMRQLFAYRANDPERKLSGIVLEVKGDLCRQLQRILKWCGREQDYVEVSLDGDIRYNPLNNSLDPYAQAFNIASIITSIWGKGKEPSGSSPIPTLCGT